MASSDLLPAVVRVELDRCANLACPNKPGEGRFVALSTRDSVVGGHRPLVLAMCAPCAEALDRMTGSDE